MAGTTERAEAGGKKDPCGACQYTVHASGAPGQQGQRGRDQGGETFPLSRVPKDGGTQRAATLEAAHDR